MKCQKDENMNAQNLDKMSIEELYNMLDSSYEMIIGPPTECFLAMHEIINRIEGGDETLRAQLISSLKDSYPHITDIIEHVEIFFKEGNPSLMERVQESEKEREAKQRSLH